MENCGGRGIGVLVRKIPLSSHKLTHSPLLSNGDKALKKIII